MGGRRPASVLTAGVTRAEGWAQPFQPTRPREGRRPSPGPSDNRHQSESRVPRPAAADKRAVTSLPRKVGLPERAGAGPVAARDCHARTVDPSRKCGQRSRAVSSRRGGRRGHGGELEEGPPRSSQPESPGPKGGLSRSSRRGHEKAGGRHPDRQTTGTSLSRVSRGQPLRTSAVMSLPRKVGPPERAGAGPDVATRSKGGPR
jgi:hypothetical protein